MTINHKRIGVAIFNGITLGLLLASIASKNWLVNDSFKGGKSGIWQTCNHICLRLISLCPYICDTYAINQLDAKSNAIRAFACIAMLSTTVGLVIAAVRIYKELKGKMAAGCFLCAGICMIIALSIYAAQANDGKITGNLHHDLLISYVTIGYKRPGFSYGWSYILGWISSIFCFVAMVFNYKCSKSNGEE